MRRISLTAFGALLLVAGLVALIRWEPRPPRSSEPELQRIEVLYSPDKRDWMELAANEYERLHPEKRVKLVAVSTSEAIAGLLDGSIRAHAWSPSNQTVLEYARKLWAARRGGELYVEAGEGAPQRLLRTPLVWLCPADRARALARIAPQVATTHVIPSALIHRMATAPRGWADLGGEAKWGAFKLAHANPARSNSGLQALYLMALEHYGRPRLVEPAEAAAQALAEWMLKLKQPESSYPATTEELLLEFLYTDPAARPDFALIYESQAIELLARQTGLEEELQVFYPPFTIWNDHPIAVLSAAMASAEQREAVFQWVRFLRGRRMQEAAAELGFRQGDQRLPRPQDAEGDGRRAERLERFGIKAVLPFPAAMLSAEAAEKLLAVWNKSQLPFSAHQQE